MKRLALALIGLALLSGCGIKGGLERPEPMWNRDGAVAREQQELDRQRDIEARRAGRAPPNTPSTGTTPLGASEPIAPPQ
jgi:predicted small lipoprotein YifL